MAMALQQLLQSVTNVTSFKRRGWRDKLCDLLRLKDESSMLKLAGEILDDYQLYDEAGRIEFFDFLLTQFRADANRLASAAAAYQADPSPSNVQALNAASTPDRRALFEIFNMTPEGTLRLVQMRADLLGLLRDYPELKPVDTDMQVLFSAWFNRGFLSLERIGWETPACVLERLMKYEAVHEISGWNDLQKRVSAGRRCFAFFHPALPKEPIIFVQVALVAGLSSSVDDIIRNDEAPVAEADADTAIFYSISNCQLGLRGIAFGDLLIKQVVEQLNQELPHIKTFATLSPVPGFGRWLAAEQETLQDLSLASEEEVQALADLQADKDGHWSKSDSQTALLKPVLERLCAHYLMSAKSGEQPLDPVERFHMRNGARLERVNWLGDRSKKGLKQSHGLLVNYVYDSSTVTRNHERYVYENNLSCSNSVAALARGSKIGKFD